MAGMIENPDAGAAGKDKNETKHQGHAFALAICLAALAGFVDATGFIAFKGLFVSFMSGNSTKAAVDVAGGSTEVFQVARAIAVYLLGVMIGELLGGTSKRWGRPLVLMLEALLLWGAAAGGYLGQGAPSVASLLGLAMGAQNASVHKADGISVALTYVTGTLVHVGRGVAKALIGAGPWSAILPFAALWLGLVCGGLGGACVAGRSQPIAMAGAAGVASLLMGWTLILALLNAGEM